MGMTDERPASSRFDLAGKIALVTGASGGLGRHFALTLAGAGARVALAARRKDQTAAVAAEIERRGHAAMATQMDVTDEKSITHALDEVSKQLGVPTVVVNNSGVTATQAAIELGVEEWDRVFDTNARGSFLVARAAAQRMIGAKL